MRHEQFEISVNPDGSVCITQDTLGGTEMVCLHTDQVESFIHALRKAVAAVKAD